MTSINTITEHERKRTDSFYEDMNIEQSYLIAHDHKLDEVLSAIIREELKMASLKVLKEAEHLTTAFAADNVESKIIGNLIEEQLIKAQQ